MWQCADNGWDFIQDGKCVAHVYVVARFNLVSIHEQKVVCSVQHADIGLNFTVEVCQLGTDTLVYMPTEAHVKLATEAIQDYIAEVCRNLEAFKLSVQHGLMELLCGQKKK